jgi:hypothetical protein
MAIPLPVAPDQSWLGDNVYQTVWQESLKEFVHQFEFVGGGILSGSPHHQPRQAVYRIEPFELGTMPLEALIEWTQLSEAELFDIVAIKNPQFSDSYYLYGCLCTRTPDVLCYLLCWSLSPLSEHQRYGVTLFARSQQHLDRQEPYGFNAQKALQRTRHQLQTPLSLILLYADLLKTAAVEPQTLEWLESLHSTAESMHTSLNHLTDAASTTSCLGCYDLRQLVAQCCQELQPWIAEKQLTVVYSSQPLWLQVNEWQMRQVLQNLLQNAIAFSPIAGQITCEWQGFQREVVIKVSDSGPGLSVEDLRFARNAILFPPPWWYRTGVSDRQAIVLEHRGSLWAENLADAGAQFCITLPQTVCSLP